jgi:hypothetical protein
MIITKHPVRIKQTIVLAAMLFVMRGEYCPNIVQQKLHIDAIIVDTGIWQQNTSNNFSFYIYL